MSLLKIPPKFMARLIKSPPNHSTPHKMPPPPPNPIQIPFKPNTS